MKRPLLLLALLPALACAQTLQSPTVKGNLGWDFKTNRAVTSVTLTPYRTTISGKTTFEAFALLGEEFVSPSEQVGIAGLGAGLFYGTGRWSLGLWGAEGYVPGSQGGHPVAGIGGSWRF